MVQEELPKWNQFSYQWETLESNYKIAECNVEISELWKHQIRIETVMQESIVMTGSHPQSLSPVMRSGSLMNITCSSQFLLWDTAYCLPKLIAKGTSTKLLQKSSVNFIFLPQTMSWHRTYQPMLLHRISHLSPLPPLNKSIFDAHNLAQCQLSAAYLYNAPNKDYVGTEGVLGIIFVLPAVRSLCQRHSQGGIWVHLKCKK